MGLRVFLYVPNIIGYIRVALVLYAWHVFSDPAVFVPVYVSFAFLDGLDGWLARRLNQTSGFGAWLDVVVDNFGRSMLWTKLYEWGWLVSSIEWCVFVCNHNAGGAQWKNSFMESPFWVRAVMANGFRTPLGVLVVGGLHGLPVWLYGCQHGVLRQLLRVPGWLQRLGVVVLGTGRMLCFAVEMWCVFTHVKHLTMDEEKKD